jgi:hypothetical protein
MYVGQIKHYDFFMKELLSEEVSILIYKLLHCKFKWMASIRTVSIEKLNGVNSQKFTKGITRAIFTRFPQ